MYAITHGFSSCHPIGSNLGEPLPLSKASWISCAQPPWRATLRACSSMKRCAVTLAETLGIGWWWDNAAELWVVGDDDDDDDNDGDADADDDDDAAAADADADGMMNAL